VFASLPSQIVTDVIIYGNRTVKLDDILKHIHTRKGHQFDVEKVQLDVRRLIELGVFNDVKVYTRALEQGQVVMFNVSERPRIGRIAYRGNVGISTELLNRENKVKEGDLINSRAIEGSRCRIEAFYRRKGYLRATVTLIEVAGRDDNEIIFVINERAD